MFVGSTGESGEAIENTCCVLPAFSDLEIYFFSLSIVTRISIFLFFLFCFVLKAWHLQEVFAELFEHWISKWGRAHLLFVKMCSLL